MSGWLLMGLARCDFIAGLSESWIATRLIVGRLVELAVCWPVACGCIRTQSNNAADPADYFSHRFEDNSVCCGFFFGTGDPGVPSPILLRLGCGGGVARLFESTFGHGHTARASGSAAATILYVFIVAFWP